MVLAVRLHNYLATTKIDPSSCRGFEAEAFQALAGLVHYSQGSDAQRGAWFKAVWNAHLNTTGTLKAGPSNKSFFYSAILNRKNSAFGATSFSVPKQGSLDAGEYPWALDDPTFDRLDDEVLHGKGPAGAQEITWKDVTDASTSWQASHGLNTPAVAFGWVIVTGLVKKYAPEAVAGLLSPEIAAAAGLGGIAAVAFYDWTVRINNAAAKSNFAIDEQRRNFDRASPITQSEVGA